MLVSPRCVQYTPLWVAPEVMTGQYNAKVDVWSIGCVVIELCSAKEPWAEKAFESSYAALFFIATNKSEFPHVPSTLSPAGHDFIRLCLTRDVDLRPTAADLLSHPFVAEDWQGEGEDTQVLKGRGAPVTSRQATGVLQASIRETQSGLDGTGEATAVGRVSGEYQPMESRTFDRFTPLESGEGGVGEGTEEMEATRESQAATVPMFSHAQAAMTCPLP